MKKTYLILLLFVLTLLLVACGDDDDGGGFSCPSFDFGDSMTYSRVESDGTASTQSTSTFVVTQRDSGLVALGDGAEVKTFSVAGGLAPEEEARVVSSVGGYFLGLEPYTTSRSICPPLAAGDSWVQEVFWAAPDGRGGDYVTVTSTVRSVGTEAVSTAAGTFSATRVVLDKTPEALLLASTVTRYLVSGIGLVREVEAIPSTNTTITSELTAYDFYGPALGTVDTPVAVKASEATNMAVYGGRVGVGSLYMLVTGLTPSAYYDVELSRLSDNADLYIYDDSFITELCSSTNADRISETCQVSSSATGELALSVDGAPSVAGTYFLLQATLSEQP